MHFQCCFYTCHFVAFSSRSYNKVVFFLCSFVVSMQIILVLLFGLDLSCFVCALTCLLMHRLFLSGSLCLAAVAIHSQTFLPMLVHFLVL